MTIPLATLLMAVWMAVVPATPGWGMAGAEPTASEQVIRVQRNGDLYSIHATDADIRDVLAVLSKTAGIELEIGGGVTGPVTVRMHEVSLEKAIQRICASSVLVYNYDSRRNRFSIVKAASFAESTEPKMTPARMDSAVGVKVPPAGAANGKDVPSTSESPSHMSDAVDAAEMDSQGRPLYKKLELLIKYGKGASPDQIRELHRRLGSTVLDTIGPSGIQKIRIGAGRTTGDVMNAYRQSPLVEIVERHALRYSMGNLPDDPRISEQWGVPRIGLPQAWRMTTGNRNVLIAVLDTGADLYHPDLMGNYWVNAGEIAGNGQDDDGNALTDDIYGWDFADGDEDPGDRDGHGTHVAGTIAASGDNGLGGSGVQWAASLMILKVQKDGATAIESSAVIDAIDYAISKNARIVNCSFGGEYFSQLERNAFNRLRQNGILAVSAAGNGSEDIDSNPLYPAAYDLDNILAVGASTSSDSMASFSNFGLNSVDLIAPGSSILSTLPTDALVDPENGDDPMLAMGMEFAATTPHQGISGVLYDCGYGVFSADFPSGPTGYIALIQRGDAGDGSTTFATKAANAKDAGAAAVIIYDNLKDDVDELINGTLGNSGDWLPVVAVTHADGLALGALGNVSVRVVNSTFSASLPSDAELYGYRNGTSMAAPHVTGAAGLLLSFDSGLTYAELRNAILDHVDPIVGLDDKLVSGGRLNVLRSLCNVYDPVTGDLDDDGTVGLPDAILALQIASGGGDPAALSPCVTAGGDADGDGRAGPGEAVFALQKAAQLR